MRTSLCLLSGLLSCLPFSEPPEPPEPCWPTSRLAPIHVVLSSPSACGSLPPPVRCPVFVAPRRSAQFFLFTPRRRPAPPFPPGHGLVACPLSLLRPLATWLPLPSATNSPPTHRGSPVPFGHFLRLRRLTSPPALLASGPASLDWRTGPPWSPPMRRPFPAPPLSGQTSLLIKRCIGRGSGLSPRESYKLGTPPGSLSIGAGREAGCL